MEWFAKKFEELTVDELYRIIQLRINVFVVEQDCPYEDCDDKDQDAIHIFAKDGQQIVAYSRVLRSGTRFPEPSIGRLIAHQSVRGTGMGKQVMRKSIEHIFNVWNEPVIKISAQEYLEVFYASLGFEIVSEEYLEDGIPHMEMLLSQDGYSVD
ncbi:GNAT family N-acetyltransferase [Prolixibacteraceae bacterium JC049]|nr:GNAT family N-acetyltransferase [Prolixibacteraceae bacterium JC049]